MNKIENIILNTAYSEDKRTKELFKISNEMKLNGFLSKESFINLLKWKSPRPVNEYLKNSEAEFRRYSEMAFGTPDDRLKIHILTALRGVNYPSASAVLMFYDKKKFSVLDIRVWRQLYKNGLVKTNPKGRNFSLNNWENYLEILRELAERNDMTCREVEKRIFDYDKKVQIGNLYIN